MKRNYSLKFNIKDIIVGVLSLVLIVGSIIYTNSSTSRANMNNDIVEIYYKNTRLDKYCYELNKINDIVEIILTKEDCPELIGDSYTIVIDKNKGISVKDTHCPNKYCEMEGWVDTVNYPIVCLPNQIRVIISNPSKDSVIPLG